jgi:FtsP/CotA-like multicopper oxidase with cupredoxin domain
VYGDFVVDDPKLGIQPGQIRQHEYRIGLDHPPGAYWYHPHLHGSTAIQVGSGMAGALIIKGDIDRVPEIAAATERVFVFQAPISDAAGSLESFTQVADSPGLEGPFLINGVRRPRIVMQRGEVQNWHFINAAIFNFVNLRLDDHALNVYSHDGNPRRDMLAFGPEGQNGVVLAPANRASALVQAGAPGTYQLRTLQFQMGTRLAILEEDVLADVVVVDPPLAMRLPTGPLPVPPGLASITDEELASAGGLKRIIVLRSVFNDNEMPITDPPAGEVAKPGDEISDWIFQTGKTTLANKVFAFGSADGQASSAPGLPTEYIPYQSRRGDQADGRTRSRRGMDASQHESHPAPVPHARQSVRGSEDQRGADRTLLGGHDRASKLGLADQSDIRHLPHTLSGLCGPDRDALPHAHARRHGHDASDRDCMSDRHAVLVHSPDIL